MSEKIAKKPQGRVGLLDEVRGFAIICMVVYHAMYDLRFVFGLDVPIFFEDWFDVIRDVFAGMFIFISGTVCRYSRNNLKRGAQCFFIGMVMTFVMPFFTGGTIYFGILHFLGVSMMLFGLGEKLFDILPAWVGIIVCTALFVLTWNVPNSPIIANVPRAIWDSGSYTAIGPSLSAVVEDYSNSFIGIKGLFEWHLPEKAYQVGALFPLGLHNGRFASSDYFPMLPWFFLFIAGSCFGVWAKNGSLPKFFYPTHIKWLSAVGKYTIWIYVLHQPVLYLIFSMIFR